MHIGLINIIGLLELANVFVPWVYVSKEPHEVGGES